MCGDQSILPRCLVGPRVQTKVFRSISKNLHGKQRDVSFAQAYYFFEIYLGYRKTWIFFF